MGDEDRIDRRRGLGRRPVPLQVSHSRPKQGVGQEAHSVPLDQDGGVADVGDAARGDAAVIVADLAGGTHHPGWVIAGHPTGPKNLPMRGRRIAVTVLLVVATLLTTAFGFAL